MKHKHLLHSLLAALLSGAVTRRRPGAAQTPPSEPRGSSRRVTFRAEVNYVEVDARVVDAQGKFVPDLTQDDFQVLEDGKPQKVTIFSLVNHPGRARRAAAVCQQADRAATCRPTLPATTAASI